MTSLTASNRGLEPVGDDWTQYMQWDGQDDSLVDLKDMSMLSSASDTLGLEFSHPTTPYPISPSTTANGDQVSFLGTKNMATPPLDLPTPSHSSHSADSPNAPNTNLSGETLWERTQVGLPQIGNKRKFSEESSPSENRTKAIQKPAPKKRPHNIIEKRYRANLNEKIAELRDSVPSLRVANKSSSKDLVDEDDDDVDGATPANKLNKASILTKATEYIKHLEMRNKKLDDENKSLKQRLLKLENMMAQGASNITRRDEAFTTETMEPTVEASPNEENSTSSSRHPPEGLIPVSDIWKKFRASAAQSTEHYGHVYDTPEEGSRRGGWPTKLMIGSLAGLMIMEGFSESDQSTDSTKRGLFGIPLEFLDGWWFLRSPRDFISAFMIFCRSGGVLPMAKGFLALSILAFLIFAYLFNSKPTTPVKPKAESPPERAPSLASPIEVRRAAWLTSTQILRIPHHSFFPEWLALTNEWFKYTVRLLLGWATYSWLTGRSGEDELARVKAWDIAIDAQLAGGDVEISRSRLILTIFASGLLPSTPERLMLKALHCRLVLYAAAAKDSPFDRLWNRIGVAFADYEWGLAQKLHATLPVGHPDRLPPYAAALLARDASEVMLESVLHRAYNLLYDRPTNEGTAPEDVLMDVIVEDHAIRSPLDALSAWFSSHQLRKALVASLTHSAENVNHEFDYLLHSAIAVAPEGSAVHTRAIALKAVFFDVMRAANIQTVFAALPSRSSPAYSGVESPQESLPVFIDSSTPLSACPEISIGLQCAMAMAMLQSTSQDDQARKQQATALFVNIPINPFEMTLFAFIMVNHVLEQLINESDDVEDQPTDPVTQFARPVRALYHWSRIEGPDSSVLTKKVINNLQKLHETTETQGPFLSRRQSSISNDTGYVSSGEVDFP